MDPRLDLRYSPLQAAELARVSPRTVRAWIKRFDLQEDRVNFSDLLALNLARQLRRAHSVPNAVALTAVLELVRALGPLGAASARLWVGGKKIWTQLGACEPLTDLGTRGQFAFETVVRHVAEEVEFDRNGEAARWFPDGRGSDVVVDPEVRWGEPVLKGTRISTWILHEAWRGEGADTAAYKATADLYEIPVKAVHDAVRFERRPAA